MSRPWIIGIVCCCLLLNPASVGWGQDYLDLPEDPQSEGSTLGGMWSSLKDKLKRNPPASRQSNTRPTQRSNSRSTNVRNAKQPSSQAQTTRRNVANQPPTRQQSRQQPQQQPRRAVNSGTAARPKASDFLPDTKLFSRGSQQLPTSSQRAARQLTPTAKLPHLGNKAVKPASRQVARKSPSATRANELDAALADLLQTKPATKSKSAAAMPQPTAKRKLPSSTNPLGNKTFDLRKALLDEDEDSIAAEAADAAEQAAQAKPVAPVAKPVVPQVAKAPAKAPTPQVKAVEAPLAETKPQVQTAPLILDPTNDAPSTQQAITIAQPRPNFSQQPTNPQRTANDPFEGTAKQVFSSTAQPTNPMRPFQPATVQPKPQPVIARPERGVLQTTQQPVIVSHVEGPRSILVGQEATYQVTLENTSNTQASNLSAEISVPEWAELVDAMSTSGVVERKDQGADAGVLEWKLSQLDARSSQALRLRLIPRSGRPLQLGVRWSQAPAQSQAVVEVQEPKLELAISGPQEVRFGKPQRYRLTLRNPGTGLTEQVLLRLVPPGGDPQSATTQKIGNLKPGEVKDIDLELTAREAGELLIQADAIAQGGLKAETTKTVLCRKPELNVDWRGPDKKYAGTVAAYYFRVRNPGTASTEPVDMRVKLPSGAEFVSASEGFSINTATGVVSWRLAALDVSEEQFMQLRCKIVRPGVNDFQVIAKTNDGELTDSKSFKTEVIALADLKLEVIDPQGPLPLGESVAYEIRVRNRGTTSAENINIVGMFSEGIDPTTVEGAQFNVRDGRVSFHPIKSLPAGREVVLRIHAKANQVGTHTFRTEVTCQALDIKLAAEETTRFFEDEHRWEDGQTPYTAEREAAIKR